MPEEYIGHVALALTHLLTTGSWRVLILYSAGPREPDLGGAVKHDLGLNFVLFVQGPALFVSAIACRFLMEQNYSDFFNWFRLSI